MSKPIASLDEIAFYLTHRFSTEFGGGLPHSWTQTSLTYSIGGGFTPLEEEWISRAVESWDEVLDLDFTEVTSGGNIRFVEGNDGRAFAHTSYSYYVGDSEGWITGSTISIDTDTFSWNNLTEHGAYGYHTIIHEFGHSLGLGDPAP